MSGLTCLAPSVKPTSNFSISGTWTPPMKPTLFVVDFSAAAAPTRNEPCSSAKTRLEMVSPVALAASTSAEVRAGGGTDEERALLLGEDEVGDVLARGVGVVDDREGDVRELRGDLGQRGG